MNHKLFDYLNDEGERKMKREVAGFKLYFRNGETWTIKKEFIGDLWIKKVTTSFGRIKTGDFQKIRPCESFKIEIFQEADHVNSNDINLGGLEQGMFDRATRYPDIEFMEILFTDADRPGSEAIVERDKIYFPYSASDVDGMDNSYQSTFISKENHLYIVIDTEKDVYDIYKDKV